MADLSIGSNLPPIGGIPPNQVSGTQETTRAIPQDTVSKAQPKTAAQGDIKPENPVLTPPKEKQTSLYDYLSAANHARSQSRDVHQESAAINEHLIQQRRSMVDDIIKSIENNHKALDELETTTKGQSDAVSDFVNKTNDQIQALVKKQNDLISSLEKGNAEEKKQCDTLSKAYDTYKKGIDKLGPINTPEKQADYDKLTADYNKAVDNFNVYWGQRSAEIKNFNAQIQSCQNEANQINQSVTDFINANKLDNISELNSLRAPAASQREVPPVPISAGGPPPPFVTSTGKSGVPAIPKLSYKSVDASKAGTKAYDSIYQAQTLSLQSQIDSGLALLQQLSAANGSKPAEPLLNQKPLMEELLTDTASKSDIKALLKNQILGKMLMDAIFEEDQKTQATQERTKQDEIAKEKSEAADEIKKEAVRSSEMKKEIEKTSHPDVNKKG